MFRVYSSLTIFVMLYCSLIIMDYLQAIEQSYTAWGLVGQAVIIALRLAQENGRPHESRRARSCSILGLFRCVSAYMMSLFSHFLSTWDRKENDLSPSSCKSIENNYCGISLIIVRTLNVNYRSASWIIKGYDDVQSGFLVSNIDLEYPCFYLKT